MDPSVTDRVEAFLESWEIEIRAGYTADEELDLEERFFGEQLGMQLDAAVERWLEVQLRAKTDELLSRERGLEAGWIEPTVHDRIAACFADLSARGVVALECAGKTLRDGWGYVGLHARPTDRGAVFFHQEDVFDAVRGWGLLLAFGGCGAEPASDDALRAIAEEVLASLGAHGVEASWTGHVADRIELDPFEWQKRRWTTAPPVERTTPRASARHARRPRVEVSAEELERYAQPVWAYRTTFGFDAHLSFVYRGVWQTLGGERGQMTHLGEPHVFLPAGSTAVMGPCDAYENLPEPEAAAIRARALATRP